MFFDQCHQSAFPEAYAMCKWCGYWKKEKEGEEAKRCKMFFCGCPGSVKDRLGYDWGFEQAKCQSCGKLFAEENQVQWPADDSNHPYKNMLIGELASMIMMNFSRLGARWLTMVQSDKGDVLTVAYNSSAPIEPDFSVIGWKQSGVVRDSTDARKWKIDFIRSY
ncbi:MAG: hypothetical protein M1153_00825 [Patescibacteria group bacterium]|nr:hypothetical protein [Patescibacteria group bacterium]